VLGSKSDDPPAMTPGKAVRHHDEPAIRLSQRMVGRQRRELFHALVVKDTVADQDRTNALLRESCEGRFEIAICAGIHTDEM
jgi:hypothetical protein